MGIWTLKFKNLLNFFLQSSCPICQRPASGEFCPSCTSQLHSCHLQNPTICQQPLPVFAWGAYGGMLKRAIALMKYENHPEIARPLGEWLGEAWMLNLPQINCQPVVVPIPLHPHKLKQRGYNQALLIAESFCDTTNLKLKPNGLERVRETKAQYGLTVSERQKNLAEAFYLGRDFRYPTDTPVLIIDDIYTTGATARSAVQLLHEHNVPVYGLVTVATTIKGR